LEIIDKAIQGNKGALLFSAHLGNWEIAPFILSKKAKISVIARPLDHKLLEKKLLKIRTGFGAEVIHKHQASKQILRLLRKNEMVAILIDQNVLRSQAVFVDFFGKPAATTPSLAMFHLRTSSPLIPVFCYPSSSKGYIIKIMPPLEITLSGDHSEDILKITQLCTKIIEDQIQKDPSLWMWFHNRWKSRPLEETADMDA
jgi:KDO2-lipid IV(A) lauroyltransferase